MRAMFNIDMTVIFGYLVQSCGTCVAVALFMGFVLGNTSYIGACVASMVPLMVAFALLAYDEQGNWQSFRLAMPVGRREVVAGRYLAIAAIAFGSALLGVAISILVEGALQTWGSGVWPISGRPLEQVSPTALVASTLFGMSAALLMVSALLPPAMKQGMTNGVRLYPFAIMIVFVLGAALLSGNESLSAFIPAMLETFGDSDDMLCAAAVAMLAVALFIYVVSLFVSRWFYASREF